MRAPLLGFSASVPLTLSTQILSAATRRQSTTRHLILVAATGPLTLGPTDATVSGFDPWDDIAIALKQVISLSCLRTRRWLRS